MQQGVLWDKISEAQKNGKKHSVFKDEDESEVELNVDPAEWDGVISE